MRLPKKIPQFLPGIVVHRREPETGAQFFGDNIEVAAQPVLVTPQNSPDPIRQSIFTGQGRAPTQRQSSIPVALHLNIGAIHAVMEDTFLAGKVRPAWMSFQRNGDGGQLPFTERQTIDRGTSAPYGNRVSVQAGAQSPNDVQAHGLSYTVGRRV